MTNNQEMVSLLNLYKADLSDNQYALLLIAINSGEFIDKVHLLECLDHKYGLNPQKARENWQIV